jgi:lysophospholipase L1-like esterase
MPRLRPRIFVALSAVVRSLGHRARAAALFGALTLFFLVSIGGELGATESGIAELGARRAFERARRAPEIGEAISIEDRSGHALDAFHRALRAAEAHHGQVRVVWYGASHTAGDEYVGMIRQRLQDRFGDAGPGFVLPVKPFLGWNHRAARVESGGAWRILRGDRGPVGDHYGLAGYAAESLAAGAWGRLDVASAENGLRHVGAYEVFFLHQPGGGRFEVRIDGRAAAVVDTDDPERTHSGYARFRVRDAAHTIAVRTLDRRPTRIFGVAMERDRSGVIIDTLGIPGSRARSHLRWNDSLYREQLRRRRPSLVVLAYGTNESEDVDVPLARYEQDLTRVVRRIRGSAPGASCLLIGPSDRPNLDDGGALSPRPLTAGIVETQRRVAAQNGCGFFDTVAFMGGPMSMERWVASKPAYGRPDHVHFTWHGHRRLADVLGDALLEGYATE